MRFVGPNMDELADLAMSGFDIVCSCPTCGYMLKRVISEGAWYSDEYQKRVGADEQHLKLPKVKPVEFGSGKLFSFTRGVFPISSVILLALCICRTSIDFFSEFWML